ncbi:MAG TPA: thioredoxin domain-containing protein [Candidatus Limnocylindria bacterium]|nr:thioredoxin domain-containing protein [Candidatus Limnocylindria bacterium]
MSHETKVASHTNRLANETSPYLLQHAHNPVDWYPWGPEALNRARELDRPIFLSIGYSACHWCHVMERESFEDPETAAQLNEGFVAIKVDREERPDLDDVYMAAVQAMTGGGGWPMSVFLTPDLRPFFGGTYFPPDDGHGLPAFRRVLEAISDAYRNRRGDVEQQGSQLAAHLESQLAVTAGATDVQAAQLELAAARIGQTFDPLHGGFGGAPKFPAPMTLEFLLRRWRLSRDEQLLRMTTFTLDRMADGGIHDQLGGGFARYSTDAQWLAPHFEKMLYDNAQLAHAYLEAYRATGEQRYADVARSTVDFMLRELRTEDGGLASALDADSEGEEGRFYVWSHDELTRVLASAGLAPDEIDAIGRYWDVTPGGNWEGHTILHVAGARPPDGIMVRAREALLSARAQRVRPGRDDKQLASWNGMAVRAIASVALVLGDPEHEQAVRGLTRFVRDHLLREEDRVWRTTRGGRSHTPGFAEDYANLADGLLNAHAALGTWDDLLLARHLVDRLIADFWHEESGTLFDTADEHDRAVARPRSLLDNATPSANAVAADVMLRLALLTGEPDYDRRARSILRAVQPVVDRQPSAFGRFLSAADRALAEPVDVVVAGDPGSADATAIRREAAAPYAPDLVIASLAQPVADWPLFDGKAAQDGRPTAYVCRGYACDRPTSDPTEVREQVVRLGVSRPGS